MIWKRVWRSHSPFARVLLLAQVIDILQHGVSSRVTAAGANEQGQIFSQFMEVGPSMPQHD